MKKLSILFLFLLPGCVTKNRYNELAKWSVAVARENEALRERMSTGRVESIENEITSLRAALAEAAKRFVLAGEK